MSRKNRLLASIFSNINAFLTKVFLLPIILNYKQSMQLCFEFFSLTIYWTSIGCIFAIRIGTNCTFYFQGAQKTTSAVDLVIANIPERLHVPGISTPPFSIPYWNAKYDKFMLSLFLFSMQYLHDDGALLIFHPEDPNGRKNCLHIFLIIISRLVINLSLDLYESTSSSQSP